MSKQATIYLADSRKMPEIGDNALHLAVTSPPYWHIKDYGVPNQIGYGQSLHEYIKDLYLVWAETFRILRAGRRLVINIGDQFARAIIYGRYKVIPLHAEVVRQCEHIGFDYMGSIIWQKKTSMNTTGGATVMGSYPHPPNGMVEIDYEHILIFKKPGKPERIPDAIKKQSTLTKEEWKEYFLGHWYFGGARQIEHEAMFPEELPRRIIKMFSFTGETVLDPFLGSGTTAKVALDLNRSAVGYEINAAFRTAIEKKLSLAAPALLYPHTVCFQCRPQPLCQAPEPTYEPGIRDAVPQADPKVFNFKRPDAYKVLSIADGNLLVMNTGLTVKLLGLRFSEENRERVRDYLQKQVVGKEVLLRFDQGVVPQARTAEAYVYLKNRIFINKYLLQAGMAAVDISADFSMKAKFLRLAG